MSRHCKITFKGQSIATFASNTAISGGAVALSKYLNVVFMENSSASFIGNVAERYGGAIFAEENCNIKFTQNSKVIFNYNSAEESGGGVQLYSESN